MSVFAPAQYRDSGRCHEVNLQSVAPLMNVLPSLARGPMFIVGNIIRAYLWSQKHEEYLEIQHFRRTCMLTETPHCPSTGRGQTSFERICSLDNPWPGSLSQRTVHGARPN